MSRSSMHLLGLDRLGLGAEVGGGGASALEEAGEERLNEGVEDDGGTAAEGHVRFVAHD